MLLEMSEEAQAELLKMSEHVTRLGNYYGESSSEYRHALQSFNGVIVNILRLGGKLTRYAEMDLLGYIDSGFYYGVNTHPADFTPQVLAMYPNGIPDNYPRPCTFSINS